MYKDNKTSMQFVVDREAKHFSRTKHISIYKNHVTILIESCGLKTPAIITYEMKADLVNISFSHMPLQTAVTIVNFFQKELQVK